MTQPPYEPQQYSSPPQYGQPPAYYPPQPGKPRKKRRVFLWVFLAVQVIFIIWLAVGLSGASHSGADAHAQAVQWCSDKSNWQYLYKSQADCVTHYGNGLNAAGDLGNTIGAGLVIGLWVAVDAILGIGYGIYRLASRR